MGFTDRSSDGVMGWKLVMGPKFLGPSHPIPLLYHH